MCVSPYIVEAKGKYIPVPCGHCIECLKDWSKDWSFRLWQECKRVSCPIHLTLTYSPEFSPVAYNEEVGEWQTYVSKREVQLFLKRLRKACPELKGNLRYFAVGEYGGSEKGATNRAHYHLILISPVFQYVYQYYQKFLECWGKGFIYLRYAGQKQIGYLTGYLNKLDTSSHITQPFKLFSKHLGLCYLTDKMVSYYLSQFTAGVKNRKGYWQRLPRYYRKKLDELSSGHPYLSRCGMTYSDVRCLQKYVPHNSLDSYFNFFCEHYTEIYRQVRKSELTLSRKFGYEMPELRTNTVFKLWCKTIPDIVNAQAESLRKIEDIKVKHKLTKIYPRDINKITYNESIIQYGFYSVQKKKSVQSESRIPPNYGFWSLDSDTV